MTQELRYTTSARRAGGWTELTAALRSLPTMETIMAGIVVAAFALPIVTFSPQTEMNGVNRAANQLSRKVIAGQERAGVITHEFGVRHVSAGRA